MGHVKTRKRRGPRPFAALLVVGVLGSWGIYSTHVFQDALGPPAIDNGPAIDDGASTPSTVVATTVPTANPLLPDIVYVRPAFRIANFVETSRQVGVKGGVPIDETIVMTAEVDYVTPIASLVFDTQGRTVPIVALQIILTSDYSYEARDPWVRFPLTPEMQAYGDVAYVRMYQDVATPEVRAAATDVIVTGEVVRDIAVTTYQFDVPWIMLPDYIDPTISPIVRRKAADSMPEALRFAHVTLSVDTDGLVRMFDYQFDDQALIDAAAAAAPEDLFGDVHWRLEIISTSNEPSTVVPPESFIDGPTG